MCRKESLLWFPFISGEKSSTTVGQQNTLWPLYVHSMFSIVTNLAKGQKKIWVLVYIFACAGTLIPTPLIEFRYYVVPFYFLIMHTHIDDNKSLVYPWYLVSSHQLLYNVFVPFSAIFLEP